MLMSFNFDNMASELKHVFLESRRWIALKNINLEQHKSLKLIHGDIYGPMKTKSLGGAIYLITITNDLARKTWLCFMKTMSAGLHKFKP